MLSQITALFFTDLFGAVLFCFVVAGAIVAVIDTLFLD